ncbi:response regulator [Pseudomonas sp. B6002]|uniref:response regulator n=1 Tax=Pseudomonas sp. B6002 TaxID=2726978 RepID=UPI0015A1FE01|nr:response regulator [Pseudomonas sp. B6002]NVZ49595.1 response regulator [Pseudomonas sp. B6002]
MPGQFSARDSSDSFSAVDVSRARVLVVDDHPAYRFLLGSLLERLGVAYQCCCNGQEALQRLTTECFDLMISDCRMPVMDGYALTRELRMREQAQGRLPLVVLGLTGGLGPEEIRQCVACGMDGWLIKPVGFAQLREVLCYWLASPKPLLSAGLPAGAAALPGGTVPSRVSLIETFGTWEVVEPLLLSLVQEADADLAVLAHAQATQDATMAAQRLHRLVGSVAFLGATGLDARAVDLIKRVQVNGVAINTPALRAFCHDVERYLNYLTQL